MRLDRYYTHTGVAVFVESGRDDRLDRVWTEDDPGLAWSVDASRTGDVAWVLSQLLWPKSPEEDSAIAELADKISDTILERQRRFGPLKLYAPAKDLADPVKSVWYAGLEKVQPLQKHPPPVTSGCKVCGDLLCKPDKHPSWEQVKAGLPDPYSLNAPPSSVEMAQSLWGVRAPDKEPTEIWSKPVSCLNVTEEPPLPGGVDYEWVDTCVEDA